MSSHEDYKYRGGTVRRHPKKGMLPKVWYEAFSPGGEKLGEANSSDGADELIDNYLDG